MIPSSTFPRLPAFHPQRSLPIVVLCAALGSSCASPCRQPIDDCAVAEGVSRRATTVADLEVALALADLGPLRVPRPASPVAIDPADPQFWITSAYLYEPGVRQARRRVEARRASARAAGRIPSIDGSVERVGAGGDRDTEIIATLDLLALLGVGPAPAARELAGAEVCDALGELEAAIWSARFRVLRALVKRDAAIDRENVAAALAREALEDEPRISTLEREGRMVPAEVAWSRATVERLRQAQAQARIDLASVQAELAIAAGLPPDHAAFEKAGPVDVVARLLASVPTDEPPARLLASVPTLRALKLKYAVAEARVRSAAAATWPAVAIGPKATLSADDVLTGGVIDVRLPLPGATQPILCAAIIERTAAREAVEDELLRVLARSRALRTQLTALRESLERSATARRTAAEAMWRASRAKFRSDDSALTGWNLALDTWLDASLGIIATRETIALLTVDLREILGSDESQTESPRADSRSAEGETR